jgi:hypothetical protein
MSAGNSIYITAVPYQPISRLCHFEHMYHMLPPQQKRNFKMIDADRRTVCSAAGQVISDWTGTMMPVLNGHHTRKPVKLKVFICVGSSEKSMVQRCLIPQALPTRSVGSYSFYHIQAAARANRCCSIDFGVMTKSRALQDHSVINPVKNPLPLDGP